MKLKNRIACFLVVFVMAMVTFVPTTTVATVQAATTPSISKKSVTIRVGKTYDFNIKNKIKGSTYKWTSADKSIATVNSKNGLVKAVSEGTVKITCKITTPNKKTVKIYGTVTVKPSVTPTVTPTVAPAETTTDTNTLASLYKDYFYMGLAVGTSTKLSTTATALVKADFNSMTAENAMKPDALLNQYQSQNSADGMPVINTTTMDSYLAYAQNNGLKVRGHVLVWHSQTPTWFFRENYTATGKFVTADVMTARMESYIKQVVTFCQTNYPGLIYAWDVVNEVTTDGGKGNGLSDYRTTGNDWYSVYGDYSYVEKAFEIARKYVDKGVNLYYNDFNTYDKYASILSLLEPVKKAGNIDGIGMQSHLSATYPTATNFFNAMDKFIAAGYTLSVTELDITALGWNQQGQTITDTHRNAQTKLYGDIMAGLVKRSANIESVTFWGLGDNSSWRAWGEPLLFDQNLNKKDAYHAVVNAVK